jgi:hypothetical protein
MVHLQSSYFIKNSLIPPLLSAYYHLYEIDYKLCLLYTIRTLVYIIIIIIDR